MRRAAKVDANHGRIVAALRQAGCLVLDLSGVGGDCPDILVRVKPGCLVLCELKDGDKPPSARRLTEGQQRFADVWGSFLVTSVSDALILVNRLRGADYA